MVSVRAEAGWLGRGLRRRWCGRRWRGEEIRLKPFDEYPAQVAERNRFLVIQSEEIAGTAGDGWALRMNVSNLGEMLTFQSGGRGGRCRCM